MVCKPLMITKWKKSLQRTVCPRMSPITVKMNWADLCDRYCSIQEKPGSKVAIPWFNTTSFRPLLHHDSTSFGQSEKKHFAYVKYLNSNLIVKNKIKQQVSLTLITNTNISISFNNPMRDKLQMISSKINFMLIHKYFDKQHKKACLGIPWVRKYDFKIKCIFLSCFIALYQYDIHLC